VLEGVIPLETFPLVEWNQGELADVPSFTVLKTQICVTRPQCVKAGNPKFTLIVIKVSPILPDYYQNRSVSKNFIKNSKKNSRQFALVH
jgi:hypothetical protein